MNDDRTLERAARSWLEAGPTEAPDHAVDAALLQIQTTRQERDWLPWRIVQMNLRNAVAIAAVVAVLGVGAVAIGRLASTNSGVAAVPAPSVAPTSVPSPSASSAIQPTPAPSLAAVGALTKAYVSDRYAYKIWYPAAWQLTPGKVVATAHVPGNFDPTDFFGDPASGHGLMVTSSPMGSKPEDLAAWSAQVSHEMGTTFGNYLNLGTCDQPTRTLVIDGEPANEVDYICKDHDWLWVTAIHGGRAYQIAWLDDGGFDSSSLRALLDRFLATYTFTS
jgi:hypothetical protein